MIWNAISGLKCPIACRYSNSIACLLSMCTSCFLYFFRFVPQRLLKQIFLPRDCMKDQCLLVLTFRLLIVACFSYLVSVQICEIVTVSSLCPSRNWRDVVLSTLCSALGTRVSRRICVSASTRLSSTLSKLYSRDLKSLKWMSRMIFEYFEYENVSKFTDFMSYV